ncbi:MAG: S24 family peptidase [Rhodobiaceae bacterium]|nr:S24 family peptidase [Rhodobiaceae bacterium]
MSDPQLKIRLWLQRELDEGGRGTKGALARHLGVRAEAITRMANTDPDRESREIRAHEYELMREFFDQNAAASGLLRSRLVTVAAHVQAGDWAETWEWADDDKYDVAVPQDDALSEYRLYGAETRGPSMNRKWEEGTVVVFTNVEETMESPIPGKRYVVERRRPGGDAEHTVKLLHLDPEGKLWLMPESDDPRFQTPIPVDDGIDGEEVRIIGRVWYAVSRE